MVLTSIEKFIEKLPTKHISETPHYHQVLVFIMYFSTFPAAQPSLDNLTPYDHTVASVSWPLYAPTRLTLCQRARTASVVLAGRAPGRQRSCSVPRRRGQHRPQWSQKAARALRVSAPTPGCRRSVAPRRAGHDDHGPRLGLVQRATASAAAGARLMSMRSGAMVVPA